MIYLIVGLIALWVASELFVDSSCKIAQEFHVPKYIIGIVITSLGTSLPELILSLYGAFTSHVNMVIGNIVGSNIANIAVGLGLLSVLAKKSYADEHLDHIKTDQSFLFLSTLFIMIGSYFMVFDRLLGIVALLIMFIFITLQFQFDKGKYRNGANASEPIKYKYIAMHLCFVIFASILIYFGAKWTINGGVAVARYFNISELIIGLITIAFGTSLPEIAVVTVACRKGEASLALGNIIGSNIYNVCFILALTGVIMPLNIQLDIFSPIIIYLLALTLLTCFALRYTATKLGGSLLLLSYIVFVGWNFS